MAIHSAGPGHRLAVLVAVLTHGVVGYTLVSLWRGGQPGAGLLGGILPDIDLLFPAGWPFPFVHRGLLHTPVAGGFVVGAILVSTRRRTDSIAVAVGFLSHLAIDTLTASGVAWLYPVTTTSYAIDLEAHAAIPGVLIWAATLGVLLVRRRFRFDENSWSGGPFIESITRNFDAVRRGIDRIAEFLSQTWRNRR